MKRTGKLLPLAVLLGVGLLLWRTGLFGFLPTDRTVVWRFPVPYGEVRKVEMQLWAGEELLKQQQLILPTGLVGEPSFKFPLASGPHRAIASVWLKDQPEALGFQLEFDPGSEEAIVIEMKKP